jgi:ligand-binding sensor domain-containing protein
MIKRFFALSIVILSITDLSYSQLSPAEFRLGQGKAPAAKINADNPASNSISDILTIGDTVWIGTAKGVSLSTDRGENWTNFYGNAAFGDESISAIANNNGVFWAATAHSYDKDGSSISVGSGLRYTSDYGKTWKSIPQPVDNPGDSLIVYGINDGVSLPKVRALPVTVVEQNLIYDIAFTKNTVWIATFAGGLRKSTDYGQTWQRVLLPSDALNSIKPTDTITYALQPVAGKFGKDNHLNHRLFSVIAVNDSTLYAGTAGGINKSTDNGISWQKFNRTNQENPVSGNFVVALGYNKYDNAVWGATWRAEGSTEVYGVSVSTDNGANWSVTLEGEKAHNFGFKNNKVYALTDNAPYATTDNGASWIAPNSIIDSKSGISLKSTIFYAAASSGNDVWLGSSDGLAKLTESFMWTGPWKVYFASQPLASSTETYAYPNPFSPKLDVLKIKYSTNNKAENVTIRIFDFGMNLVKTVIQNAQRGNPVHLVEKETGGVIDFWNGKDESGRIVPNGVYFYRIDVGSSDPVFGKIIVLQ